MSSQNENTTVADNGMAQPPASAPVSSHGATHGPAGTTSRLSTTAWMAILVYPLIVSAATILWSDHQSNRRMEALIAERPDIAVVDDIALIQLAIDNGADRYQPAAILAEISDIVKANGMENTILLSKSMIMYAPDANRLDVRSEDKKPARRELTR